MLFAIELYFDPVSEACIKGLWETLARGSISSTLLDSGARPHISLAVLEDPDLIPLGEELRAFTRNLSPLSVKLTAVGTFPTLEGVVFLAPVVTLELLSMHQELHRRLAALGLSVNGYYLPGHWIPHCTAAMGLPPERVPLAVQACRTSDVFQEVRVREVGLIRFRPNEVIFTFPVGDQT
jgi:2'-5' RNA ligase